MQNLEFNLGRTLTVKIKIPTGKEPEISVSEKENVITLKRENSLQIWKHISYIRSIYLF